MGEEFHEGTASSATLSFASRPVPSKASALWEAQLIVSVRVCIAKQAVRLRTTQIATNRSGWLALSTRLRMLMASGVTALLEACSSVQDISHAILGFFCAIRVLPFLPVL
jgi:hypothetical protein